MNRKLKAADRLKIEPKKEVKLQEGPIERALRLSSDQVIAMAIRDLIKRDELN